MNPCFRTLPLLLCLLLSSPLQVQAQPSSKVLNTRIARQASQLLESHLEASIVTAKTEAPFDLENLDKFLGTRLFQTELLKDNWYSSRIAQLKRQTGVQLSAFYQQNEYGAYYDDFENDVRFRAGLEYDLLENGLFERKNNRKRMEKDQEIHQMESLMGSRQRDYSYLYNCLIYNFNKEKILLLRERIPFLKEYIHLLYELYFAHELSYDQIIDQKSRLKEAEIMLAAARQFNEALEKEIGVENIAPLAARQLPIVQIDVEALLDPTDLNNYQKGLQRLKSERIDMSYRKRMEARLRLFARYNYGSYRTSSDERAFTSFGMSFQAPIQFNKKSSTELATLEKAMVEEEVSEVWYNRVKEIMILFEEYQYKMKQYSNFLHKTYRIEEKMRVEKVLLDSRQDVHSPMKAIRQVENRQAVMYELIHLKQQLYLLILKIHLRSFQKDFIRCLEPLDLSGGNKKLQGQRFVLLDNVRDSRLDPEYLIKYLQKNEIENVLLSGQSQQLGQWAEILSSEGFRLYGAEEVQGAFPSTLKANLSGQFRRLNYSGQLLISSYVSVGGMSAAQLQLTTVPDKIFNNRNELERWIQLEKQTSGTEHFLFEDIRRLMELDKKNLGVEK